MSSRKRRSSRKLMANRIGKRPNKQVAGYCEKVNEATLESSTLPNRTLRRHTQARKNRAPVQKDLANNKRKKHLREMKESTRD